MRISSITHACTNRANRFFRPDKRTKAVMCCRLLSLVRYVILYDDAAAPIVVATVWAGQISNNALGIIPQLHITID